MHAYKIIRLERLGISLSIPHLVVCFESTLMCWSPLVSFLCRLQQTRWWLRHTALPPGLPETRRWSLHWLVMAPLHWRASVCDMCVYVCVSVYIPTNKCLFSTTAIYWLKHTTYKQPKGSLLLPWAIKLGVVWSTRQVVCKGSVSSTSEACHNSPTVWVLYHKLYFLCTPNMWVCTRALVTWTYLHFLTHLH